MTILELQYDADAKRLYLKLTRNSFWIFFPANDIVSYREFISSPLHVRLQQLYPTRDPVEGFVRPIFSFSCSDKYPTYWQPLAILITFNLPVLMQSVLSTTLTRGIMRRERGAQFPERPVTMGARNDYRVAEKSQQCHRHFLQYTTFSSKISQVRTWGRQTCFLLQAPSNLVTPLTLTRLLPLQLRFERIQYISLS